jgi:hypothetical protein
LTRNLWRSFPTWESTTLRIPCHTFFARGDCASRFPRARSGARSTIFGSTNEHFVGVGAWDGDMTLGDYGVDVDTHTVWAVVNHNSQFAVVPEPSALVLLAAGAVGLVALSVRRRRGNRVADAECGEDDCPMILLFPSQRLRESEGRRRAA